MFVVNIKWIFINLITKKYNNKHYIKWKVHGIAGGPGTINCKSFYFKQPILII